MPFYVDSPNSTSLTVSSLKVFKPSEFVIETAVLAFEPNLESYDFTKVYITYAPLKFKSISPRATGVESAEKIGNPIINVAEGRIIGHVSWRRATFYVYNIDKKASNDDFKDFVIVKPPVDEKLYFPEFLNVNVDTRVEADCGMPVGTAPAIYLSRRFPAEKVVNCFGTIKYVKIAGLRVMTYDYYLYKFAKKVQDLTTYNFVQRLLKSANIDELPKEQLMKLVEEDKRIKYLKIDPQNNSVLLDFELDINLIRAYDEDGEQYLLKLRRPLKIRGKLDANIDRLKDPHVVIEPAVPHSNLVDRMFEKNQVDAYVCTGNITVNSSSVTGIIATLKSILEVIQYPNLDNIGNGYDFLKYLIKNGYLTVEDLPFGVMERYGIEEDSEDDDN